MVDHGAPAGRSKDGRRPALSTDTVLKMTPEENEEFMARLARNQEREDRRRADEDDVSSDEDPTEHVRKGKQKAVQEDPGKSPTPQGSSDSRHEENPPATPSRGPRRRMHDEDLNQSPASPEVQPNRGRANSLSGTVERLARAGKRKMQSFGRRMSNASRTAPLITINRSASLFGPTNKPPEHLLALIISRHHTPLTMCTNEAFRRIRTSANALRFVKVTLADNTTARLLDTGAWPPETEMSVQSWREAWNNFLDILRHTSDADVVSIFDAHYTYLCAREELNTDFDTVIRFDIEIRQNFFAGDHGDFYPGDLDYTLRFHNLALQALRARTAAIAQASVAPPRRNNSFRFDQPSYSNNAASSSSSSFQYGKHSAAGMLCLRCGRSGKEGHSARNCNHGKTVYGGDVFSVFNGDRLVTAEGGHDICLSWNLSGSTERCKTQRCPGGPRHICSVCGAAGHHAGGKSCSRARPNHYAVSR